MPTEIRLKPFREVLHYYDSPLQALNPEKPLHRAFAKVADLASLEALNPEDMTHNAMTESQLTRWMQGDKQHMTRFFVVDPKDFKTYVDMKVFNTAKQKAIATGNPDQAKVLDEMRKLGVVGYTYMYNDAHKDPDFRRRAGIVREKEELPSNRPVWELNEWFVPGAQDEHVYRAVDETLRHLVDSRLSGESVAVMFVEASELHGALTEKLRKAVTLKDLAKPENRIAAEGALQDTRVLKKAEFAYTGLRVKYEKGDQYPDFVYVRPLLREPPDIVRYAEAHAWDRPPDVDYSHY